MTNERVADPKPIAGDLEAIARGAGIGLLGYGIFAVLDMVYQVFLARLLGPTDIGIIGLALSTVVIATIPAMFGLQTAILRFIGIHAGQGDGRLTAGAIITGLRIVIVLSLFIGITLFAFADNLAARAYQEPAMTPVLRVLAIGLPFTAVMYFLLSVTDGLKRTEYRAAIEKMIVPLLKIGGSVMMIIALGLSTISVALAIVLASLVGLILAGLSVWRLYPLRGGGGSPILVTRTMLVFSWPLMLTGILDRSWQETQTQVLGILTTSGQVGIYYVVLRVATLLPAFLIALATIFSPIMADLHNRRENERLGILLKTVTRWGFSLCLPVFLFLFIFSEDVLMLFGPIFVAGAGALRILAVSQLIHVAAGPVGWLLIMSGRSRLYLVNTLLILGLNLTLALLLIPRYGILGAAASGALSILLITMVKLIEVYVILRIHPYDLSNLKPIAAGIVSVVAVLGISFLVHDLPPLVRLALSGSFLMLTYIVALVALRLDEEDQLIVDTFRQHLGQLRSGRIGCT